MKYLISIFIYVTIFFLLNGCQNTQHPTKISDPFQKENTSQKIEDISHWINTAPLTLNSLKGKVVLIDFWTYTCINCIRTLNYLKDWHSKYNDSGLVIIGIHTPEFEFEKNINNVETFVVENQIEYAVGLDNEYSTWRSFNNIYWPAKYLIDQTGEIKYQHFGEGNYNQTEKKIRELLSITEKNISNIPLGNYPANAVDHRAFSNHYLKSLTRELYAGYVRNYSLSNQGRTPPYISNTEYYSQKDTVINFKDPGNHLNQFMYIHGDWLNEPQNITKANNSQSADDSYIAVPFFARSVNMVSKPLSNKEAVVIEIMLNNKYLTKSEAGKDIKFSDNGVSYLVVDKPNLYNIISLPEIKSGELKITSLEKFSVFAFTFGAYINTEIN